MFKKLLIAFSFSFLLVTVIKASVLTVSALQPRQPTINNDTLMSILQQKDYFIRQRRLVIFIKNYVQASLPEKTDAVQDTFNRDFVKYSLKNRQAFLYFMKSIAANKHQNLKDAEAYMVRAVQLAAKNNEHYLSFQFLSHLGFIQTDRGNFIGAIYNYRMATKEVILLKDKFKSNRQQASLNINISDLYYKSGFYSQSLNYLDKAWSLISKETTNRERLSSVIYYNKSENFFRMNNYDSLKVYHEKLNDPSNKNYKIFTYRQRTAYYLNLLRHNYPLAIEQIKALKLHKNYAASELEDQQLANAYFESGQLDSAKKIINQLLVTDKENNHPEIKYHLYETLAWIAEKKKDSMAAASNFKLALEQSQENNLRLTQVGSISTQLMLDETENSYIQKTEVYEKERVWLLLIVLISALTIIAIALFYRNIRQKRHYETLLYAAKKEELAFINSHEVRKHLTNILGIIDILQHSDDKIEEYEQSEKYLIESASCLDKAIKSISEKLNE